jgi:hypothetical protein
VVKRLAVAAAMSVLSLVFVAPQASANEVCYDLNVTVQGQTLVSEAGCQDLP